MSTIFFSLGKIDFLDRPIKGQDIWGALERNGKQRVAILDGVTPHPDYPLHQGVDTAAWAANLGCQTLLEAPWDCCFQLAHQRIWTPSLPVRQRPQTTAVLLEIGRGVCRIQRVGDCQAWVKDRRGWRELAGGDMLSPDARRKIMILDTVTKPDSSRLEYLQEETLIVDKQSAWLSSSLGRFETLQAPRSETFAEWTQILLHTDGVQVGIEDPAASAKLIQVTQDWLNQWDGSLTSLPLKSDDDATAALVEKDPDLKKGPVETAAETPDLSRVCPGKPRDSLKTVYL